MSPDRAIGRGAREEYERSRSGHSPPWRSICHSRADLLHEQRPLHLTSRRGAGQRVATLETTRLLEAGTARLAVGLELVELELLSSAPRRWTVVAHVEAPRQAVWDAFIDAPSWPRWFPGVSEACYPAGTPPFGVGTRREAIVRGQRWVETVLAFDEGERWAYRIDRATVPLARAQIECTEFADEGTGTRLRWTLAARPRLLLRASGAIMPRTLDRLLRRAARNLERDLGEGMPSP